MEKRKAMVQSQQLDEVQEILADVVVAGAGIGGLTSALTAQEAGARVLVLEKGPEIGGSAASSGGTVWCAENLEAWLSVNPDGNPTLGKALIDNFCEGVNWLGKQGVELEEMIHLRTFKFARRVYQLLPDARSAINHLAARIIEGGGTLLTNTPLRELRQNARGQLSGALALGPKGFVEIQAHAVVLATGGFPASPDLCARYFGRWAGRMVVRSNPYSTGDGFTAALGVGAGTAGPFSRFYGHMLPTAPASTGLHNFVHVKPDFSEYAIFINLNGERFDDEFLGDEVTVNAAIHQPEAIVILIYDEVIRRKYASLSPSSASHVDRIAHIRQSGGEILEAATLERLANEMASRWNVRRNRVLETLSAYNTACASGDTSLLSVPKSGGLSPITTSPFYAIRMVPGITFPYGGARVNARAEVVYSTDMPIPGLYAAGADAGGIYTRGYTGGLSLGLAYGRIAGKAAARVGRQPKNTIRTSEK